MNEPHRSTPSVPLCVYVCWHHDADPKGAPNRKLAQVAYDWLRGLYVDRGRGQIDLHRFGLGVPVYYRASVPEPAGATPHLSIADIDLDGATRNVLVLLIDHHMVNDPEWRRWLRRHVPPADDDRTLVLPVALHDSAFALGRELGQRNFLRLGQRPPGAEDPRPPVLQRRLTEVCLRALANDGRDRPADGRELRPLQVFISHAKGDGRETGARFREAIYKYGQITAFFDENDLPLGHRYDTRLDASIQGCDAMLCIVSDLYSSRPWCRREVDLARTPQRNDDGVWFTVPTLAVDELEEHPTQMMPELGYTTAVRYREGREDHVLDLLLREALVSTYHRRLAAMLRGQLAPNDAAATAFLTWVPELHSLRKVMSADAPPRRVVYPGHGLTDTQETTLRAIAGVDELLTYEQLTDRLHTPRRTA